MKLGYGWYRRLYKATGIAPSNIYAKIVFSKEYSSSHVDAFLIPQVGRVRINNLEKMNSNDRYLEDRYSATFYVDAKDGSDNNDGLSPEKAVKSLFKVSSRYYQPGDKILFKKGQTYNGSLEIRGFGNDSHEIYVGSYGSGTAPKLAGRSGATISIAASGITVDGLEVTNAKGTTGIYIEPMDVGEVKNITVKNCNIHDVNTAQNNFAGYATGGIIVQVGGGEAPTWINGLHIKNNTITDVSRVGITVTSLNWAFRPGRWGNNDYAKEGWYPLKNCVVSGNTVKNSAGDGIVVFCTEGALIEKNTVYNAACTKHTGYAIAGLWTSNTSKSVIQYNEVAYTRLKDGNADGEAFDIDITEDNTTLQYNYSHDNESGFLLMCNVDDGLKISKNAVVRYNLSVNDATKSGQGVFMLTHQNPGTQIYNNTIYMGGKSRHVYPVFAWGWEDKTWPAKITFTNNIFYGEAGIEYEYLLNNVTNVAFNYNLFHGVGVPPSVRGVTLNGNVTGDPGFKNKNPNHDNRAAAIAGFTPGKAPAGAVVVSGNGGKDINGASIGSAKFFGAVKY